MKSINKARTNLKKRMSRTAPDADRPAVSPDAERNKALAALGIEIWRLGNRLKGQDAPRIEDSHTRLLNAFEAIGGRIEDRAGETFFDGLRAEILDQPDALGEGAHLVVAETVRPAVYLDGQCVVEPQVILALAPQEEA